MSQKKKINYIDIKNSTGLGIGTISRFFNGGSISQKSRKIMQDYIEKHNYEPNIGAKLIKGIDNSIYLIACSIEEKSILTIISSVIDSFKKDNINVYVVISSYDWVEYKKTLQQTINRKPKTLILLSPILNLELTEYINSIDIDTYIYGSNDTNKPSIIIDEKKLMFEISKKILEMNYKKIIYVGKSKKDITTGKMRFQGFKKGLGKTKIEEYFIEKNNIQSLENIWPKIKKDICEKTIIVCGTHTIFKFLYFKKIINNINCDLTDIGYKNDYDKLLAYKFKIFIDFYNVGFMLSKMVKNKDRNNYYLNYFLIEN